MLDRSVSLAIPPPLPVVDELSLAFHCLILAA